MSLNEMKPPDGQAPEPVMLQGLFDGVEDVRRLELRPGDVIVFRIGHRWMRDAAEDMLRMLQEQFPDHRCILLAPDIDIGVMGPE